MIGTNFGIYRPNNNNKVSNNINSNIANNSNNIINVNTATITNVNPNSTSVINANMPAAINQDIAFYGAQLSDFMQQLEDYVPTVPDPVTAFYLNSAGFDTSDPRIVRLISVATQKFISDIANDALQHCKSRTHNQNGFKISKVNKDRKYTMTLEDLAPALADFGITVRKAQYFQ